MNINALIIQHKKETQLLNDEIKDLKKALRYKVWIINSMGLLALIGAGLIALDIIVVAKKCGF